MISIEGLSQGRKMVFACFSIQAADLIQCRFYVFTGQATQSSYVLVERYISRHVKPTADPIYGKRRDTGNKGPRDPIRRSQQ